MVSRMRVAKRVLSTTTAENIAHVLLNLSKGRVRCCWLFARLHEAVPDMLNAASKVKIKSVKPIVASRRATSGSEVTSEVQTTAAQLAAVKNKLNVDSINKALAVRSVTVPLAIFDRLCIQAAIHFYYPVLTFLVLKD
jgi:hypothetical protein